MNGNRIRVSSKRTASATTSRVAAAIACRVQVTVALAPGAYSQVRYGSRERSST